MSRLYRLMEDYDHVLGYVDANGIEHESYSDACHYYGVDSPEDCAAEDRLEQAEELQRQADASLCAGWVKYGNYPMDDLPF